MALWLSAERIKPHQYLKSPRECEYSVEHQNNINIPIQELVSILNFIEMTYRCPILLPSTTGCHNHNPLVTVNLAIFSY